LLVATAADVGQRLFALRREQLLCEGRTLAGGWPGTVPEARALSVAVLTPLFAQRRIAAPTHEELGWVMHAAYDEARRAWRASVDGREEPSG
jgi:hypothetical protein